MVCQANLCTSNSPSASAAEVTSNNVVGYTRLNIAGGKLNCVALQFQDVGASDATTTIAKITSQGIIAGSYDTMETEAPCIMIFNGVGYDYYYYITDAYDADGNEVTAWATAGGDEAGVVSNPGEGFWSRSPVAGKLTFARPF